MNDLKIRRGGLTDHVEWLRMRIALWPTYPLTQLEDEICRFAAKPEKFPVFVVQRADGRLGGFLEANLRSEAHACSSSPVAYIEGWYVDEDLRRQGVGGWLVKAAEEWARSVGCTEIASDCELENTVSFCAHTALGYTDEGRLIHFRKALTGSGKPA